MTTTIPVPPKEHSSDFSAYVLAVYGDNTELSDLDLLEKAESKAPKFSIHHLEHNGYIATIDPFYSRTWNCEFSESQCKKIQGLNSYQLCGFTVLYFRSDFPKEMILDAIKLSFI